MSGNNALAAPVRQDVPPSALSDLPPTLSAVEAARVLHLSVSRLASMRCLGIGPRYHKVGSRRVVYLRADLMDYVTPR
jgi:hypothetical protein